jgi:hypothetical protein
MKVRVARSFDREDIPCPSSRLSSGIARRVIETRHPLLSVDAGRDDALLRHGQRRGPAPALGDVRADHPAEQRGGRGSRACCTSTTACSSRPSRRDDLELMRLLADQASIAMRNARLLSELRERNEQALGVERARSSS